MDPDQHARFLDYLERYEYFGRGDSVRLGRDEFVAADTEYTRLTAMPTRSAYEQEVLDALRVLLLRD
jgi:hypothetical protein